MDLQALAWRPAWPRVPALLLALALVQAGALASTDPQITTLRVLVVHTSPGHSAVHLERGGEHLYWDPGGGFGTEYRRCLERGGQRPCRHLEDFPWELLERARSRDVFRGDAADLDRILLIYHRDTAVHSEVITFELHGEQGREAWQLLADGAAGRGTFRTQRPAMFCSQSVSEYLQRLGGEFSQVSRVWFPSTLASSLRPLPSGTIVVRGPGHGELVTPRQPSRTRAPTRIARNAGSAGPYPSAYVSYLQEVSVLRSRSPAQSAALAAADPAARSGDHPTSPVRSLRETAARDW